MHNKPQPSLHLRYAIAIRLCLVTTTAMIYAGSTPSAHAQVVYTDILSAGGDNSFAYPIAPVIADTTGPGGALRGLYGTGGSTGSDGDRPDPHRARRWAG